MGGEGNRSAGSEQGASFSEARPEPAGPEPPGPVERGRLFGDNEEIRTRGVMAVDFLPLILLHSG